MLAEAAQSIRKSIDVRPTKPLWLWAYIDKFYHRQIPYESVCAGHNAPFDFMVGACLMPEDMAGWSDAELERYKLHEYCVVHANRSGGKTEDFGIANHIRGVHWHCGITILGGSQKQSWRMHEVMRPANQKEFCHRVIGEQTMSHSEYVGGGHIEILASSPTSVRSPHTPIVDFDEVDEFDPKIHGDALSIAQSMGGIASRIEQGSTAHKPGGLMAQVIKGAEQIGRPVYRWCVWEVCKRCPYPCTPKKPYKKCRDLVKYDQLNQLHRFSDICDGKAKRSAGYLELGDLWKKFEDHQMSWERFSSEWLCEMPQLEDAVFPMLSAVHMANDWDGWRDAGWDIIAGVDGGSKNFAAVWAAVGPLYAEDEFDTFLILADLNTGRLTAGSDFADMFVAQHRAMGLPPLSAVFTGNAVPDQNFKAELDKVHRRRAVMRRSVRLPDGRPVIYVPKENQRTGHAHIETLLVLRPDPSGTPRPGMLFRKAARPTYDAMYHDNRRRKAEDEPHPLSAMRYLTRGWHWRRSDIERRGGGSVVVATRHSGR